MHFIALHFALILIVIVNIFKHLNNQYLDVLTINKILRKESSMNHLFKSRSGSSSPWIQFVMPTIFASENDNKNANNLFEFTKNAAIAFELKILLNSPQPDWALLLKILLMRNSYLCSLIFSHLINNLPSSDCFKPALDQPFARHEVDAEKCNRFLCGRDCHTVAEWANIDEGTIQSRLTTTKMVSIFFFLVHRSRWSNQLPGRFGYNLFDECSW